MKRLAEAVRRVVRVLATTLLVLVLAEAGLRVVFFALDRVRPHSGDGRWDTYGAERMQRAYPGWRREDVERLLAETAAPYEYDPWAGFRNRSRQGRYVNVSIHGYRLGRGDDPWPPDASALNIFFFGGSTAFGAGLPDSQTVPSQLHDALARLCPRAVRVYNFGQDGYYSAQERALFEQLVTGAAVPGIAVFFDGLNDAGPDLERVAGGFGRLFGFWQTGQPRWLPWQWLVSRTALARLATAVARRLGGGAGAAPAPAAPTMDLRAAAGSRVRRWIASKRLTDAAATAYGVTPIFVIQPTPHYRFDLASHPFRRETATDSAAVRLFLDSLAAQRGDAAMRDVVWLADLQAGRSGADLYLDGYHYTAAFAAELGRRVAREVVSRAPRCGPAHPT